MSVELNCGEGWVIHCGEKKGRNCEKIKKSKRKILGNVFEIIFKFPKTYILERYFKLLFLIDDCWGKFDCDWNLSKNDHKLCLGAVQKRRPSFKHFEQLIQFFYIKIRTGGSAINL